EAEAVLPARLPADLVGLAEWMATEYCSTMARALLLMLPPGASDGAGPQQLLVAELTEAGREALRGPAKLNDRQREALARLESQGPAIAAEIGTTRLRR